jgi:hypothetical protein
MNNLFKVACSVVTFLLFFPDPDFCVKTATCGSLSDGDKYWPGPISAMSINILLKQPEAKLSIVLTSILTHQEMRPSDLGGVPTFPENIFLSDEFMYKFRKGDWACCAKIQRTPEEIGHKPMIPSEILRHAPAVAMLNHLIWFF